MYEVLSLSDLIKLQFQLSLHSHISLKESTMLPYFEFMAYVSELHEHFQRERDALRRKD